MGAIGVFEADANESRLSAEAAASNGFELEKAVDRAIFRAQERFGAYLANSKSRPEWEERWEEVKPKIIRVIAEVTTPTPKIIRRVGAALRPAKQDRPSSAKTATAPAATGAVEKFAQQVQEIAEIAKQAAVTKTAWSYDQSTKLWTSNDPMQKFACPDCGTQQQHIGFSHCAGCDRTWNSWAVRQAGTDKTASTYVLMAREIKMRGDQYKLAADGTVKIAESDDKKDDDEGKGTPFDTSDKGDKDDDKKTSATKVAMPMQPNFGIMPGDNSGAMGSPAPAEQPPTPMAAAGDHDNDGDLAGGVTEDSPIDQIQDALQEAVVALKEVQMLSINPALTMTASVKGEKVATLRASMDRFWGLHKQLNYSAGMLAKKANEAIRAADPRITAEAKFIEGFEAAAKNSPLPENTSREYLEGYIAFHKQADSYSDGANTGGLFRPGSDDETNGARNDGSYLDSKGLDDSPNNQSDAGPFDSSQPAQREFVSQIDRQNAEGGRDRGQGESGSMKFTGARRSR